MPENPNRMSIRVYYEDTDFSGRVYHASYLRFLERGRTEWLRALGQRHNALAETKQTTFAVTKLAIEFHAAARIDDLLEIETELQSMTGAVLNFRQTVIKDSKVLVDGQIDIVAIKGDRATRPPRELLSLLAPSRRRPFRRSQTEESAALGPSPKRV